MATPSVDGVNVQCLVKRKTLTMHDLIVIGVLPESLINYRDDLIKSKITNRIRGTEIAAQTEQVTDLI